MEFGVDSILQGKVTGITKFGAFVSLPGGKSGLVHISEISYTYVSEVSDHLQEGQEVTVKVIGIDDSNRINLSIKRATEPPPRPQQSAARSFAPRSGASAPKEPSSFEDRLKQFMQASDSKLSEMRSEHRTSRRGPRR